MYRLSCQQQRYLREYADEHHKDELTQYEGCNAAENRFDYTFMGLEPGTTKAQVKKCLENWNKGDNGILDLSKAYRLKPGTGWVVPAGVLHAPGSVCTYEPQWGSDVWHVPILDGS